MVHQALRGSGRCVEGALVQEGVEDRYWDEPGWSSIFLQSNQRNTIALSKYSLYNINAY